MPTPAPLKKSSSSSKKTTKPAKKSSSSAKNEIGIKYADKSSGQPQLTPIFEEIVKLLKPYEKGDMKMRGGKNGQVALINEKEVVIAGRKKEELWFASALVQKGYVGFYFMPVYGSSKLREQIAPGLMKCLKGKACFHIKSFDPVMFSHIAHAIEIGYQAYKRLGWIV